MRSDPFEVLTPPASEPVTVAELKLHVRHNLGSAEDLALAEFIAAARGQFEKDTGRTVLPTFYRQHLPALSGAIELRRAPLLAVQAVAYWDADGDPQTIDPAGLVIDSAEVPAVLSLPGGESWPATSTTRRRPAYVDYSAGWANAAAVPAEVKVGIKLLAALWYANRETAGAGAVREIPYGFRALCDLWNTGLNWGA